MAIKDTFGELKDWLGYQRKETTMRTRILKNQRRKEQKQVEYETFKKLLYEKLDEMLYSGEYSRVVLQPEEGKEKYFKWIVEDEEFNRSYIARLTAGGELDVRVRTIDHI